MTSWKLCDKIKLPVKEIKKITWEDKKNKGNYSLLYKGGGNNGRYKTFYRVFKNLFRDF